MDRGDEDAPGAARPTKRRRTPEQRVQAAARRRERLEAREVEVFRATVLVVGLWVLGAIAGSILLGWSWSVALGVVALLVAFAATGDRGLVAIGVATVTAFGAAFVLSLSGGQAIAFLGASPTSHSQPAPAETVSVAPTPTVRITPPPSRSAAPTPQTTPTPTLSPVPATQAPPPSPTAKPTALPSNEVLSIPGLTEAEVLHAFAAYRPDCDPLLFLTRDCTFETLAGDDVLLTIEESSTTRVHIVVASVSNPIAVDEPSALEVLEVLARLPYTGSDPAAAVTWLHAHYRATGFTPEETDVGPGHFVLRVSEPKIADLELRAPDY